MAPGITGGPHPTKGHTMSTTTTTTETTAWARVAAALPFAKGMVWDGCHKIYLAMDETEQAKFTAEAWEHTSAPNIDTLRLWFAESCGLRFINAVTTNTTDPNAGYVHLIAQGELDD